MKKLVLLCSIFICHYSYGQIHHAFGTIDTNYVTAGFGNNGNLFYPLGFCIPDPMNDSIAVPFAIDGVNVWVAGKSGSNLYNSSEVLSQYQPGPSGTLPQDTQIWNCIWQISRSDILSVKTDFELHHAITIPVPNSVLTWPAKGNSNAYGNGGSLITIREDMAPFYDRNGDGVYNVYDGDYPMIHGDKMLWWINNDAGSRSQNPMGIDRRYSVYEYECSGDSNLDNTLFLSVVIKNQSNHSYDSVTIGAFSDMELGCVINHRTGCIPSKNSFYAYKGYVPGGRQQNGITCDDGSICPTAEVGYGCKLPIISATFLNDTMKCYEYINNFPGQNLPATDRGYYNYMNGLWNDTSSVTFGGLGHGGLVPYPYALPGNPADTTQWSEVHLQPGMMLAGPRYGVAAIGPFSLGQGDTISFDMAFIFHPGPYNNSPDISDSSSVIRHIDSIVQYYHSESFPCWYDSSKRLAPAFYTVGMNEISQRPSLSLIPNPNNGNFSIHISNQGQEEYSVSFTDMLGQIVYSSVMRGPDQNIHLDNATSGVYSVSIENMSYRETRKVVITK